MRPDFIFVCKVLQIQLDCQNADQIIKFSTRSPWRKVSKLSVGNVHRAAKNWNNQSTKESLESNSNKNHF